MPKLHKIGISMAFFYSMLTIPVLVAMCICTCSKKEEKIGKTFEGQYQIVGVLVRVIYLALGPLLGIALFDSIYAN